MSAERNSAGAQYRVQAYKKVPTDNGQSVRCNREAADEWWIENLVGPNRWEKFEKKDSEAAALRRHAELNGGALPIEKTHYGYSTPRR